MPILVHESAAFVQTCKDCGYEIPNPYAEEDDEELNVICSTCYFERAHQKHLAHLAEQHTPEEPLPAAKCNCGLNLHDCQVATCHREATEPPKKRSKRRLETQLSLFANGRKIISQDKAN